MKPLTKTQRDFGRMGVSTKAAPYGEMFGKPIAEESRVADAREAISNYYSALRHVPQNAPFYRVRFASWLLEPWMPARAKALLREALIMGGYNGKA